MTNNFRIKVIILLIATVNGVGGGPAGAVEQCSNSKVITEDDLQSYPSSCFENPDFLLTTDGRSLAIPSVGSFVRFQTLESTGDGSNDYSIAYFEDGRVEFTHSELERSIPLIASQALATKSGTVAPGCSNASYSTDGRAWDKSLPWYYNFQNEPNSLAKARVNSAFATWQSGLGRCGVNSPSSLTYSYAGGTSLSPNIYNDSCSSSPDGRSVIGWDILGPGILGETCTWGKIAAPWKLGESDISLSITATGYGWYYPGQPVACSNQFNFQYAITHEIGHAIGLLDISATSGQLMAGIAPGACSDAILNRLGNGDLAGLNYLYPSNN